MHKQEICDQICQLIRALTKGQGNPLKEIQYLKANGEEFAVPIFEDGAGKPNDFCPHGYYAVNITADSDLFILVDIVKQFIMEVW